MLDYIKRVLGFGGEQRSAGIVNGQFLIDTATAQAAGVSVNERSILGIPWMFAAIDTISSRSSVCSICPYRHSAKGQKTKLPKYPGYRLLNLAPNNLYSAYAALQCTYANAALHGNGYLWIDRQEGEPTRLFCINPLHVIVRYFMPPNRSEPEWVYQVTIYQDKDGNVVTPFSSATGYTESFAGVQAKVVMIPLFDMLHVRGNFGDGFTGYGISDLLKLCLGEQIAIQRHANAFFKNGCQTNLAVIGPHTIKTEEQKKEWRQSIEHNHAGPDNHFRIMLLQKDWQVQPLSLNAEEAQLLGQRELGIKIIAAITRVPQYFLGEPAGTTQYKSGEERDQALLSLCIDKYLRSMESECDLKLTTEEDKDKGDVLWECDRRKLIDTDIATKDKIIKEQFLTGRATQNMALAAWGHPDNGEDGEKYWMPTNVQPMETALNPPKPVIMQSPDMPNPEDNPEEEPKGDSQDERHQKLIEATVARVFKRLETSAVARRERKDWNEWMEGSWVNYHEKTLTEALSPILPDADVFVDAMLHDLQGELRHVLKEQMGEVWTRYRERLTKEIHGTQIL